MKRRIPAVRKVEEWESLSLYARGYAGYHDSPEKAYIASAQALVHRAARRAGDRAPRVLEYFSSERVLSLALALMELDKGAFGQALRENRLCAGIGLRELARRLGVSASWVFQVECGRRLPSFSRLTEIEEAGVSVEGLASLAEAEVADAAVARWRRGNRRRSER